MIEHFANVPTVDLLIAAFLSLVVAVSAVSAHSSRSKEF